jgi:predicted O-methyltransferase YrrM
MKTEKLSKLALLFGRLCKLPFVNPRGLQEVCGIALAVTDGLMDSEIDVLPIPSVSLMDLMDKNDKAWNVAIRPFPRITFSVTLEEAVGLGMLMQKCKASRAFEFGTHRGVSSTQLAANLPEQGQLFTLDLPRSGTDHHFKVDNLAEKEVANFPVKGDLIPEELRKKVTFLEQDSALFDPGPYAESMDFVFVDAAHTMEYVVNDSEKAWAMLKPGGILAWHDCRAQSPDVVKYLRSCKYNPRRVGGTTLAFAEKPKKP